MKIRHLTPDLGPVLALFSLAVVLWTPVLAQESPRLDRLEVAIWPEYDQTAALVMLRAHLPPDAVLPTTIPLVMPASIPAPNAVAQRGPDGGLLLAQHTVEQKGDWQIFNIQADSLEVRLEYYAPMDLSQPQREFVFEWPGGIDIGQVVYEVQHPAGATDMVVVPPPAQRQPGSDGLTYAHADLGPATAAEAKTIALAYTKTTPSLSIAALQPTFPPPTQQTPPASATPSTSAQPPSGGSSQWLVTLAIVFGVGLLVIWFVISGKKG